MSNVYIFHYFGEDVFGFLFFISSLGPLEAELAPFKDLLEIVAI